jgi:hypothetical protein
VPLLCQLLTLVPLLCQLLTLVPLLCLLHLQRLLPVHVPC